MPISLLFIEWHTSEGRGPSIDAAFRAMPPKPPLRAPHTPGGWGPESHGNAPYDPTLPPSGAHQNSGRGGGSTTRRNVLSVPPPPPSRAALQGRGAEGRFPEWVQALGGPKSAPSSRRLQNGWRAVGPLLYARWPGNGTVPVWWVRGGGGGTGAGMGVRDNHTKYEPGTQRWRPGTGVASAGRPFQNLQFGAKIRLFLPKPPENLMKTAK